MKRYAKIVATLGPSSQSEEQIRRLITAGVNVTRLNFSHGTHADHAALIQKVRKISQEMDQPIAILQDLQGPKIRVAAIPEGPIHLYPGHKAILSSLSDEASPGDGEHPARIPMDFPELTQCVQAGSRILLDDGNLELEVLSVRPGEVETRVILGGNLSSHKGVNLPGSEITIPGFTDKDRADLKFGLEQGVDLVAISFVRTPEDVMEVRRAMREIAPEAADTPIVAKLERPEALDNLEAILDQADGVMVARGDLGVEMNPATVPIAQKRIISAANMKNRFVITATQMLDSMINNPRPTRAEASDVANAIFDGTDAVMLSGETASGKYPIESVVMMDAIVRQAEAHYDEWGKCTDMPESIHDDDAFAMTQAASELAHDRNVSAIAVFTHTGRTALLMSKARPRVPILAFTPEFRTYQRSVVYWGVTPQLVPFASTMEAMIRFVEEGLLQSTPVQPGQQVVVISGFPVGAMRQPNFALLHTVGEKL
ncbi:MAG: pyruvate kinase [Chloroflexota bacterium]|nr:MAG: pyruvate kinase [Chloroflexota bacterium]